MTEILIKRLSKNINLPKYETQDSSGMDLAANIEIPIKINPGETSIIPTGSRFQYHQTLKYRYDQGQDWQLKIKFLFSTHQELLMQIIEEKLKLY